MALAANQSVLRRALGLDALASGATGLLLAGGARLLADLLALPEPLLRGAGLALLPYAALVAYLLSRAPIPRAAVWTVIFVNALWALDSAALLLTGWVVPNLLGYSFVLFQAFVVAAFGALQYQSLRMARPTRA